MGYQYQCSVGNVGIYVNVRILTVYVKEDSFAHRRWHIVRGDAQIRPHLSASDPAEVQVTAVMCICWKVYKQKKLKQSHSNAVHMGTYDSPVSALAVSSEVKLLRRAVLLAF